MIRRAVSHKVRFLLCKRGEKRYSRKLGCCYMSADVVFAGIPVRLFFIRRSKRGSWGGLLCTDIKYRFSEVYRIYSRRWSLEVIFKEGVARSWQVSVQQFFRADCKYLFGRFAIQCPLCSKTLHGIRNNRRTLQGGKSGQPRDYYQRKDMGSHP